VTPRAAARWQNGFPSFFSRAKRNCHCSFVRGTTRVAAKWRGFLLSPKMALGVAKYSNRGMNKLFRGILFTPHSSLVAFEEISERYVFADGFHSMLY